VIGQNSATRSHSPSNTIRFSGIFIKSSPNIYENSCNVTLMIKNSEGVAIIRFGYIF